MDGIVKLKAARYRRLTLTFGVLLMATSFGAADPAWSQTNADTNTSGETATAEGTPAPSMEFAEGNIDESNLGGQTIWGRALDGGPIVFSCLLILVFLSIMTWAILVAKWIYLSRVNRTSDQFIKSFWDSRSLNDLNGRLQDYPYSPIREVFRSGYAELVRGSQLREQAFTNEAAVSAAMDNLNRALGKAKLMERRRLENFIWVLAISASAAPFIGLFGTVWGIMNAFEGIARTGSASLAAVAPGISEALIATAFGLGAAIPAVIGYNFFSNFIRGQLTNIDGFAADFLNIVERYLVTDKPKTSGGGSPQTTL